MSESKSVFKWYLKNVVIPLIGVVFGGGGLMFYFGVFNTSGQNNTYNHKELTCEAINFGRFELKECCSIFDSKTQLEWFIGEDINYSWSEAHIWAGKLSVCGGGWRLPTDKEVESIYEPTKEAGVGYFESGSKYPDGKYFKAHLDPAFYKIGKGAWVWLKDNPIKGEAKSFNLNQGQIVKYNINTSKYATRVFAVRIMRK